MGTRIRILRAGAGLIHHMGFASTGLKEILSASGVPKGSFYHYYHNKEAFGLDVVDFHLGFLVSWLTEALSPEGGAGAHGPVERLRRFFEEYRAYQGRRGFVDGCPIGNLALEAPALGDEFREKIRDALLMMRGPIADCLIEARRAGELPAGMDPADAADFVLNSWEGAILRMKTVLDDSPLRTFERMVFDRLLKG